MDTSLPGGPGSLVACPQMGGRPQAPGSLATWRGENSKEDKLVAVRWAIL